MALLIDNRRAKATSGPRIPHPNQVADFYTWARAPIFAQRAARLQAAGKIPQAKAAYQEAERLLAERPAIEARWRGVNDWPG